jgi:vancomycin permeability regulator SanA
VSLVRRHPLLSLVAFALLGAFLMFAWSFSIVWRAAHHDDAADVPTADAIVVLGAAQWNGTPSPVLKGRLDHALLLYQQGRSTHVILVGSNQPGDRTTEAASGRVYLMSKGVPASAITAIPVGHTSWESLEAAASAMKLQGLHSAFLVSDPWHNARIKRMFDDLGMRGLTSATWTSAYDTERSRFGQYMRETFAYLDYRILGGH